MRCARLWSNVILDVSRSGFKHKIDILIGSIRQSSSAARVGLTEPVEGLSRTKRCPSPKQDSRCSEDCSRASFAASALLVVSPLAQLEMGTMRHHRGQLLLRSLSVYVRFAGSSSQGSLANNIDPIDGVKRQPTQCVNLLITYPIIGFITRVQNF